MVPVSLQPEYCVTPVAVTPFEVPELGMGAPPASAHQYQPLTVMLY